jgi:hypothetical protein
MVYADKGYFSAKSWQCVIVTTFIKVIQQNWSLTMAAIVRVSPDTSFDPLCEQTMVTSRTQPPRSAVSVSDYFKFNPIAASVSVASAAYCYVSFSVLLLHTSSKYVFIVTPLSGGFDTLLKFSLERESANTQRFDQIQMYLRKRVMERKARESNVDSTLERNWLRSE